MNSPKFSRLDPGQRRDQILDAANALFAQRGYDEVSIEDIASAAGSPGGSCTTTSAAATTSTSRCSSGSAPTARTNYRRPSAAALVRALPITCRAGSTGPKQNRTIWLATIAHGEDIADPDVRRVVTDLVRRAVALLARSPRRHRRGLAAAALRARVLDRPEPRRHPTLATRRSHPRTDPRTDRLDARTRPAHLRRPTQATRRPGGEFRSRNRYLTGGLSLPWRARQGRP